jgi:hypothetical protein
MLLKPVSSRTSSSKRSTNADRPGPERIGGADQIVVAADQILSGIGLISNAGGKSLLLYWSSEPYFLDRGHRV